MNNYQKEAERLCIDREKRRKILSGLPKRMKKRRNIKRACVGLMVLCAGSAVVLMLSSQINHLEMESYDSAAVSTDSLQKTDMMPAWEDQETASSSEIYSQGADSNALAEDFSQQIDLDSLLQMQQDPAVEEKRVWRASLSIETQDFDQSFQSILDRCSSYGGYIELQEVDAVRQDHRTAWITCRIPSEQLSAFLDAAQECGQVVSISKSSENIANAYYDASAWLESLEKEQERLQQLYDQAQSVSDLIEIEKAMAEVQSQLQSAGERVTSMDRDVSYSTVDIDLNEVQIYSPKSASFWDSLSSAFSGAWSAFLSTLSSIAVFMIFALPWLILAALAAGLIRFILVRKRKREENLLGSVKGEEDIPKQQNPVEDHQKKHSS